MKRQKRIRKTYTPKKQSEYDYILQISDEAIKRFEQKQRRQESPIRSHPTIKSYYRTAN